MSAWVWIRMGAILGALGVAAGAFGAHGLKERIDARMLEVFEVGARYQMYHALALLAVGLVLRQPGRAESPALQVSGWAFLVGILVFSGTLYALAVSGQRWLGAITPIGGVSLIVGWIALAVAAGGGGVRP